MPRDLLVLSGGHPYDEDAFADLLGSFTDWTVTHLIHPDAERLVAEGTAASADAMLFYDMPGYRFENGIVDVQPPSDAFKRAMIDRFDKGRGAVAMHHAIAGWALWPEWSEIIGGRFLYQPGEVRGRAEAGQRARPDHPRSQRRGKADRRTAAFGRLLQP